MFRLRGWGFGASRNRDVSTQGRLAAARGCGLAEIIFAGDSFPGTMRFRYRSISKHALDRPRE
jgi:hypothetical protein